MVSSAPWALPQNNHRDRRILSDRYLFSPVTLAYPSPSSYAANLQKDSLPLQSAQVPPPPSPSSGNKMSPAVLFIIVILAVIFFISGLLHLLVRFLIRQGPPSPESSSPHGREIPASYALQRQLQQLFHLHDSGLDQAFIDALPVFLYKEIVGPKEPFDCAVCLCEFAGEDKLRLLPMCSHAFHLNCIDTWLLSNATCPLCRETLFVPAQAIENPVFDFEDSRDEEGMPVDREGGFPLSGQKPVDLEEGSVNEKRVFAVRLGKFRSSNNGDNAGNTGSNVVISTDDVKTEEGESSSGSSLDARRCYSMGSYQYVVGDSSLQVALRSGKNGDGGGAGGPRRRVAVEDSANGKRLWAGSKGESFSVSKIWQWSGVKGRLPSPADTASLDVGLPWVQRTGKVT
uniref:RING-type E3 ubiquitin transferase n=1 Tax=Anthurium amnicola TaxID=1678845 RepID=A0A1D1YPK7_9ARAE